ncbi:MAG: hypothetical protein K8D98_01720 [Rhodanobacter sp.]|nr:hypothetical protein [Rhodanobacter sp.]
MRNLKFYRRAFVRRFPKLMTFRQRVAAKRRWTARETPYDQIVRRHAQRLEHLANLRVKTLKKTKTVSAVKRATKARIRRMEAIAKQAAMGCELFGPVSPEELERALGRFDLKVNKTAKRRAGVLQYKLQYWKGVEDRKRLFRSPTLEVNRNDHIWAEEDVQKVLTALVERSLEEAFNMARCESTRIAEILAWVNRRFDDHPLAFESCCRFAGLDAEEVREGFTRRIRSKFGSDFPHYRVLRDRVVEAEYGDEAAIQWCLSEQDGPLSFVECCTALGFDPVKARGELLLPIALPEADDDTYTTTNQAHVAA